MSMEQDQQQAEQQDAEHSTRSSASLHLSMDSEQKCKRGYLVKKGKVNTFSHRRRWFLARLGGNVQYFKDENSVQSMGEIPLINAKIRPVHEKRSRGFGFEIVTETRVWQLYALSLEERNQWLDWLRRAQALTDSTVFLHQAEDMIVALTEALWHSNIETIVNAQASDLGNYDSPLRREFSSSSLVSEMHEDEQLPKHRRRRHLPNMRGVFRRSVSQNVNQRDPLPSSSSEFTPAPIHDPLASSPFSVYNPRHGSFLGDHSHPENRERSDTTRETRSPHAATTSTMPAGSSSSEQRPEHGLTTIDEGRHASAGGSGSFRQRSTQALRRHETVHVDTGIFTQQHEGNKLYDILSPYNQQQQHVRRSGLVALGEQDEDDDDEEEAVRGEGRGQRQGENEPRGLLAGVERDQEGELSERAGSTKTAVPQLRASVGASGAGVDGSGVDDVSLAYKEAAADVEEEDVEEILAQIATSSEEEEEEEEVSGEEELEEHEGGGGETIEVGPRHHGGSETAGAANKGPQRNHEQQEQQHHPQHQHPQQHPQWRRENTTREAAPVPPPRMRTWNGVRQHPILAPGQQQQPQQQQGGTGVAEHASKAAGSDNSSEGMHNDVTGGQQNNGSLLPPGKGFSARKHRLSCRLRAHRNSEEHEEGQMHEAAGGAGRETYPPVPTNHATQATTSINTSGGGGNGVIGAGEAAPVWSAKQHRGLLDIADAHWAAFQSHLNQKRKFQKQASLRRSRKTASTAKQQPQQQQQQQQRQQQQQQQGVAGQGAGASGGSVLTQDGPWARERSASMRSEAQQPLANQQLLRAQLQKQRHDVSLESTSSSSASSLPSGLPPMPPRRHRFFQHTAGSPVRTPAGSSSSNSSTVGRSGSTKKAPNGGATQTAPFVPPFTSLYGDDDETDA